jgi:hypothetical protein
MFLILEILAKVIILTRSIILFCRLGRTFI